MKQMFILKPTPKQIRKYGKKDAVKTLYKPTPDNWEEFVNLTTIRSGGDMKRFKPYPYQKLLIDLSNEHPNMIVVKTRQLGVTQTLVSTFLHDAIINPATNAVAFMRNSDDVGAVSQRCRQMLNSIPEYAKADNDTIGFLKIKDSGEIRFKASGKEGARSADSLNRVLYDEAAFMHNIESIYAATNPATALCGDNAKKFIISTPSSKGNNWYWERLSENNQGIDIEQLAVDVSEGKQETLMPGFYHFVDKNGWLKVILHWRCHPVFSQMKNYLQYRKQQDNLDDETLQREHNLRFVNAASTVFSAELVQKCAIGHTEHEYDSKAKYYAGLDTATSGNDYVAAPIFKYKDDELSLVYLYRVRQKTSEYHLYQLKKLFTKYRIDEVGVEVNGVGQIYFENLIKDFRCTPIRTTQDSKQAMIAGLLLVMEASKFKYPDNSPLITEMLAFVREGDKLHASSGHDDCVMGAAFGVAISPLRMQESNVDYSKIAIDEEINFNVY
ncbi:MAG: terminase family protein [Cyanobacteria bacterium P01_D01_bin.116]